MKGVSGLEPSAVYVICSVYVLSIIIVYSTAIAILYYLGAMQLIMYTPFMARCTRYNIM
jgi:nucleoside permease NupC